MACFVFFLANLVSLAEAIQVRPEIILTLELNDSLNSIVVMLR